MNCQKCGTLLTENDQFCKGCGTQNPMFQQTPQNTFTNPPTPMPTQQPIMQNPTPMVNNMNPLPNYTQPMNNNIQTNPEPPKPKKDNSLILIIIGIIVMIAAIAGAVYVGHTIGKKAACETDINNKQENKEPEETTYKVKFSEFSIEIPYSYSYKIDNGRLILENSNDDTIIRININNGNFSANQSSLEKTANNIKKSGYTIHNQEIKTINNKDFMIFEVNNSSDGIVMYTTATPGYIGTIIIYSNSGTGFDHSKLDFVAKIFSTLKYVGATSNMEIETENFPMTDTAFME